MPLPVTPPQFQRCRLGFPVFELYRNGTTLWALFRNRTFVFSIVLLGHTHPIAHSCFFLLPYDILLCDHNTIYLPPCSMYLHLSSTLGIQVSHVVVATVLRQAMSERAGSSVHSPGHPSALPSIPPCFLDVWVATLVRGPFTSLTCFSTRLLIFFFLLICGSSS